MTTLTVPTEETLQAFREIEARRKDPDAPIYHDINDLFADLGILLCGGDVVEFVRTGTHDEMFRR